MKYDFYDHVKIHVKAGKGGDGCIGFHREKYISHGGPDGGDGGNGGNVVFRIDPSSNTLLFFKKKKIFKAENGGDGGTDKFHGANGKDCVINVPGWGNRRFATPTRQAPNFAKTGLEGEEKDVYLELKMLADVGFVGMPSVGKSTLLSVISAARPKIAAYHFTTLFPMLGVVSVGEGEGFVAADIPGLIEGASEGLGLGFDFLRHVDRCRLLVHVLDIAGTEGRDPIEDFKTINEELKKYSASLASRPQIIVGNKIDAVEDPTTLEKYRQFASDNGYDFHLISAATGEGIKELVYAIWNKLKLLPPIETYESEYEEAQKAPLVPTEITVEKRDEIWYVEGKWLKRLMTGINFSDWESLGYFDHMLRENGVMAKMRELGITDGDTVSIYGLQFDFVE